MERAEILLEPRETEVRERENPPPPEDNRPRRVENLGLLHFRGLLGP